MSDAALLAWLETGSQPVVSEEELAARRRNAFSLRFSEALRPLGDLGITAEEHELGVARNVYEVHRALNMLGDEEYSAVWSLLSAPDRRAIKAYVEMARRSND